IRKSSYTQQIADADAQRDTLFRGFVDTIKSAHNHFNPNSREAARKLQIALDHYGNIAQKSYDEQTAAVYNLLQDLNEKYALDISLLNLGEWVEHLQSSNIAFSELIKERDDESGSSSNLQVRTVRIDISKIYRDMLNRVDALVLINGAAKHEGYINDLNARTERYEQNQAQRKGRKS
ncbi:MAG: DUF6261 family protein, partial [Bacteroidales bacterium]